MDKKCTKYEGLFVFKDEKTLQEHIAECEDCRIEHEKMKKVSELIGEVRGHYLKTTRKKPKLRAVCAISLLLFSTTTFGIATMNDDIVDTIKYGDTLSAEDLGFPVDSYGLLMVEDEF